MDVGRQKLRKNCDFDASPRNPFARNGRWTSKTEEKLRLLSSRIATLSHEMDVGRQKLGKNCDFT